MYGAEVFSGIISSYINNDLPKDVFCGSVREKLGTAEPEYYGIAFLDDSDNRNVRLISNCPEKFEYRVEMTYDDRETVVFQDFSPNSELHIPHDQLGTIVVTYRMAGNGEEASIIYEP